MEVAFRKARLILRKFLAKGRAMGLKPLAVVVLDAGGHVKAFEREDGASPGRFAITHGKAYSIRCASSAYAGKNDDIKTAVV